MVAHHHDTAEMAIELAGPGAAARAGAGAQIADEGGAAEAGVPGVPA
jgi:hypothetical protein